MGIFKAKALLRSKVWCPEFDRKAEAVVHSCLACQPLACFACEPLKMSVLPEAPWHYVIADFYRPFPTGEHLLVIMDVSTRYPVVESVTHSFQSGRKFSPCLESPEL